MTTRRLIALCMLLLAVLPLTVLGFLDYRADLARMRAEHDRQLAVVAREVARELAERIDRLLDNMRTDAAIPSLVDLLAGGEPREVDAAAANRLLLLLTIREPLNATSVGLLDVKGRNRADTRPSLIGGDESGETYVQDTLRSGFPQLHGPLRPSWDERAGLFATAPIKDRAQKVVGLLRLRLEPALIEQVLARNLKDHPSFGALVVDSQGRAQASTLPRWQPGESAPAGLPQIGETVSDVAFADDPMRVLRVVVPNTPWSLVIAQPRALYEQPMATLGRDFLRQQGLLVLLVLVAVIPLARLLARPAMKLTAAAEAIAAGDLDRRVSETGPQEFRRLSRAFNAMNERLGAQLQELSREHERMAAVIEATEVGTWEWNVIADELRVNERFCRIVGLRASDLAVEPMKVLSARCHPDDLPLVQRAVQRHFDQKAESYDMEYRMRHSDGHWVWLRDHGRVRERTSTGQPVSMYGTRQDISQRKLAEFALRDSQARLQALNADLEHEVLARTAELAAAKDAAEQASRAKSAFLANMSHEIRTPLNGIIGLSQLMQGEPLEPAQTERLRKVLQAAQRLLAILNDVLDISKIEAGKLVTHTEAYDVAQMIEECCDLMREALDAKGLGLHTDLHDLPRHLHGDRRLIGQVLLNLLGNAVKFTERGRLSITGRALPGGHWLRLEVRDTGIGLTAEAQARVFESFEQADASTTRRFGGTGLGLSISHRLVELMGGRIGVHSVLGQGSCFWVELPLIAAAESSLSTTEARHDAQAEPVGLPLAGIAVLLVEDNDVNREIAEAILVRAGASVEVAGDGREAVAMALHGGFDLILMDMQMPGMDGLEATRRIRGRPELADTPIVAMTANVFAEDRQACLDAGMNDHLAKPVDHRVLVETVARWARLRSAQG